MLKRSKEELLELCRKAEFEEYIVNDSLDASSWHLGRISPSPGRGVICYVCNVEFAEVLADYEFKSLTEDIFGNFYIPREFGENREALAELLYLRQEYRLAVGSILKRLE